MTPYDTGRNFILQNDEDFDVRTPALIAFKGGEGNASENPGAAPPVARADRRIRAKVVMAANQGCVAADYPANTAGKIAVVYTPFPFFDASGDEPLCLQSEQEAAAEAAGAVAVVHDFVAENTSPQFFDAAEIGIPALFADHETATGMVAAGKARLMARKPSWGYLRVYDAETGEQVAKFDRASNVHTLLPRKARGASTTPRYWANARTALGIRTASSPSTSASWAKEAVQAANGRPVRSGRTGQHASDPGCLGRRDPVRRGDLRQ